MSGAPVADQRQHDDPAAAARHILALFRGRENVHAVARLTGRDGERGVEYHPERRALTLADVERHVRGETVLGVYPLRADSTVYFATIDLDTSEKVRAEANGHLPTLPAVRRLGAEAVDLGVPREAMLLSFSGRKGHHLSLFFAEPVPAADARRLLALILSRVQLSAGISAEAFPKQDRLGNPDDPGSLGNLVKLPLATHPISGQRADLIDECMVVPLAAEQLAAILSSHGAALPRTERRAAQAIPEGPVREPDRHNTVASLAGSLRHRGLEPDVILTTLRSVNLSKCQPPLPDEEVRDIAEWTGTKEPGSGTLAKPWNAAPTNATVEPATLAEVEAVWMRWLAGEDPYPLHVALGAIAANHLEGDPVWIMLVGGSGSGKTEAVMAGTSLPATYPNSTISGPAALLSATPRKDRKNGSTGGLLRQVGDFGIILLKDFTSVISMNREARAELLSALREVYDGRWDRSVGAEGGQVLSWSGKAGLIAGCTTVIDGAHAVISSMGDRWLMARMPDVDRHDQSRRSIQHSGHEKKMRAEIAAAVAGLFSNGPPCLAPELSDLEIDRLVTLADIAALARSPVQRDYRGDLELILDPEAATRIAKQLAQLFRGLCSIGLERPAAWATVARVGLDCIPKLRRAVIRYLELKGGEAKTSVVAEAVEHPTQTTRRSLEDLAAHGVVIREAGGKGKEDLWSLSPDAARALRAIRETVPEMSEVGGPGISQPSLLTNTDNTSTDISGKVPPMVDRAKRCPDGHRCLQPPTGSVFCCGQPVTEKAEKQ